MTYEVAVRLVEARATAVIATSTTWEQFPSVWPTLLGEVWECLRAGGVERGCPNVMLYRGDGAAIDIEIGVELRQPCRLTGRVVSSLLPAGLLASTVHCGPYSDLPLAHDAVQKWCADHGYPLSATRWEVYGPHRDDPASLTTEVTWLLATP